MYSSHESSRFRRRGGAGSVRIATLMVRESGRGSCVQPVTDGSRAAALCGLWSPERLDDERLEVRDQLLRLGHQEPRLEAAARDPALNRLDEAPVLRADRLVEREVVGEPLLVDAGADEVVEELDARSGRGTIGPIERFGRPGMTLTIVAGNRKWNCPRSTSPSAS